MDIDECLFKKCPSSKIIYYKKLFFKYFNKKLKFIVKILIIWFQCFDLENEECVNTFGSYVCVCSLGYLREYETGNCQLLSNYIFDLWDHGTFPL